MTMLRWITILLLNNLIMSQYNKIFILNNNIYINKYPVEKYFDDNICEGLLNHFTESYDEDDETKIGAIDEIMSIYAGLESSSSFLIGAYYEGSELFDPKIYKINLFDEAESHISTIQTDNNFVDLDDETDYVTFIHKAFQTDGGSFNIRIANYSYLKHITLDFVLKNTGVLHTSTRLPKLSCYFQMLH